MFIVILLALTTLAQGVIKENAVYSYGSSRSIRQFVTLRCLQKDVGLTAGALTDSVILDRL